MLGKTNTPTFGWIGATHNLALRDHAQSRGTSIARRAARAAAPARRWRPGSGPLAIGTDGGGSIRIPASCAGHLRPQALVRPRADLSGQRRVEPLAHRAHDAHGGGRRADAERVRGARRARPVLAAGRRRGLRQGAARDREGAARGVDATTSASPRRRPRGAAASARARRARFRELGCRVEEVQAGVALAARGVVRASSAAASRPAWRRTSIAATTSTRVCCRIIETTLRNSADEIRAGLVRPARVVAAPARVLREVRSAADARRIACPPFKVGLDNPTEIAGTARRALRVDSRSRTRST